MKKSFINKDWYLGLICLLVIVGVVVSTSTVKIEKDPLYDIKIEAYEHMEILMKEISQYKSELGITMSLEDKHNTGMIGQSSSDITTSLGSIESKRTSANPDMAALLVELLYKAGIRSGDRIGGNFSGSFPSLNLAVLSACKAMNVECIYISSVGSSNYGANDPELTFLDMVIRLTEKGLIKDPGVAFSLGGSGDVGDDLEEDVLYTIRERINNYGLPILFENDYNKNLLLRQELLEKKGKIDCFVTVGGNITSLGKGESSTYFGQGLLVSKLIPLTENSGLIDIYRNKGVPVIHLLNLKKLTADYGLGYDPEILPWKGTSSIFVKESYNSFAAVMFLLLTFLGLFTYCKKTKPKNNQ